MKIALLGDIAFLGNFSLENNSGLIENLKNLSDYLAKFDLVVGNLETPFSVRNKRFGAKSAYLKTDLKNIEVLKALHVSAVNIANNHIFDYGKEGFQTTIRLLEENGIEWFGAQGKDYKTEQDGNRIIFNGFCCYSTNPLGISKKYGGEGLNPFDFTIVADILRERASEGWLNILSVHSGIEHVNTPSISQIKASRQLADIAPYIYYGHHPHVVQGIEHYKDSVIAHSLGNFCFSGQFDKQRKVSYPMSDNNRIGMILELEIKGNKVIDSHATLIWIAEEGNLSVIDDYSALKEYSRQLAEAFNDIPYYEKRRSAQRRAYIEKIRERRNIRWYLKRLRPRYFHLLVSNRMNSYKYKKLMNVLR